MRYELGLIVWAGGVFKGLVLRLRRKRRGEEMRSGVPRGRRNWDGWKESERDTMSMVSRRGDRHLC